MKDLSHWQLRKTLAAAAEDDHQQPPHARAFAAWVQLESLGQAALLGALADEATKAQGAARETSHVAVLGYAASLDDRFVTPFADGLAWLRARQYFVQGRPLTFEIDGLALLGVATGLSKLDAATSAAASAWLDSVLAESISRSRKPDWNESLIQAALAVRRQPGGAWSGSMVADDLVVALSAKGLANASEAVRANAWTIISSLMGESDGMGSRSFLVVFIALLPG